MRAPLIALVIAWSPMAAAAAGLHEDARPQAIEILRQDSMRLDNKNLLLRPKGNSSMGTGNTIVPGTRFPAPRTTSSNCPPTRPIYNPISRQCEARYKINGAGAAALRDPLGGD